MHSLVSQTIVFVCRSISSEIFRYSPQIENFRRREVSLLWLHALFSKRLCSRLESSFSPFLTWFFLVKVLIICRIKVFFMKNYPQLILKFFFSAVLGEIICRVYKLSVQILYYSIVTVLQKL